MTVNDSKMYVHEKTKLGQYRINNNDNNNNNFLTKDEV